MHSLLLEEQAAEAAQRLPDAAGVLVLALVQGLTEFLPVSSSGHLVLMGAALQVPSSGLFLTVALHMGTLMAVMIVYRQALWDAAAGLFRGSPREAYMVALGTLPAVIVGLSLHDLVSERFQSPRSAAAGLLVTAVILWISNRSAGLKPGTAPAGPALGVAGSVSPLDALLIGCGQAVAILPGISRSGTTIAVGLMRGLAPADAARFSFLLSVPAVVGAAMLELGPLLMGAAEAPRVSALLLFWGIALSALVGWAALRVLLVFLARGAFRWFAVYCVALGLGYLLFA